MDDEQAWQAPVLGDDGKVQPEVPPPLTITGLVRDEAAKAGAGRGSRLFVTEQPPDAGIGGDGGGGGAEKKSGAETVGDVAEGTELAVSGSHGLGYWTGRAARAAKEAPTMKGLEGLNNIYTYPLIGVEGFARTADEVHNGAPVGDAVPGNMIRSGLVMGATALGDAVVPIVGGAVAGYYANKYLPDGTSMGRAYSESFEDTGGRSLLLP